MSFLKLGSVSMPSLEQLKNLKASFGAIADQTTVVSQLDLPPDDLPLPDSEPSAPPPVMEPAPPRATPFQAASPETAAEETPVGAAPTPDSQTPAGGDRVPETLLPGEPPPPAETSPSTEPDDLGLGFEFADLLGGDPANLPPPPAVETVIEEAFAKSPPETAAGAAPPSTEAAGPDEAAAPVAPKDMQDIPDLDFDDAFAGPGETEGEVLPSVTEGIDLGNIYLGDDNPDAAFADFAGDGIDDADIETAPGFSADDDFKLNADLDIQDLPDFDNPALAGDTGTGGEAPFPGIAEDAADLPGFSDDNPEFMPESGDFPDFEGIDMSSESEFQETAA